jgi:tetratricopeptide (TPR) repeat protein
MAFGFGFNKAKVLNSAEKHVQQGKIQNAINDYEKVLQHDPKDLAILNTLGDLYARVGNPDRAASYFKKVGESYAAEGFTVKAIALYKKITKINPSGVEEIRRLAELYTQQNLLSDARQQYLLVAEHYTKTNHLDSAIAIFQKMLEFDPENVAMQTRLADLYVRMGKKDDAQEIFFRSAQALQNRGSGEGADEALTRVLTLSPGNPHALLMRAQIAVEAGNHAAAVRHLESIPNIDSSHEGLACLLRARLAMAQPEEAEPLARKLLVVHDDLSGLNQFADWLTARGQFEAALRIYAEHSDRLLASNPERLLIALRTFTERVKENATALELVLGLLQKAGEQSQITEVIELLAHALVQKGDLVRARDYYRDLSILEPQNPVHEQNYRQMVARLGEDSMARSFSAQEGGRAFMADELETFGPSLEQSLEPQVNDALEAALTESELLDSYSLHPNAIAKLESVLAQAPRSARLHQRLATVYAHSERFEDAARSCDVLSELYQDSGHAAQAKEYTKLAVRYRQQAAEYAQTKDPIPVESPAVQSQAVQWDAVHSDGTSGAEAPAPFEVPQPYLQPESAAPQQPMSEFAILSGPHEFADENSISVTGDSTEADAASEFTVNVESDAGVPAAGEPLPLELPAQPSAKSDESTNSASLAAMAESLAADAVQADVVELDISDEWQPAFQASADVPSSNLGAGNDGGLDVIVETDEPANSPTAEMLEEIRFYIGQQMWDEAAAVIRKCAGLAPELGELTGLQRQIEEALRSAQASSARDSESVLADPAIESGGREGLSGAGLAEQAVLPQPEMPPAMVSPASSGNELDNLVAGLEDAIPLDLAPVATKQQWSAPPVAAAADVMSSPVADASPQTEELDLPDAVPVPKNELSELFEEFKQEAEQAASDNEDPESHYSLGVAFREMGLLDEAIGELQKVARNVEMRRPFRDTLQVYTLLGQCFLEKGVPEAAVRWYEKALTSASDGEARVAVHYELGSAYEAAGSRPAALQHFMEVYGANIDYRDVAERIRVLKS